MRALHWWPNHLPKAQQSSLGIRISTYEFGEDPSIPYLALQNSCPPHMQTTFIPFQQPRSLVPAWTQKSKSRDFPGMPAVFKILKEDIVKVLHSICEEIWNTQHGHSTGKGQFSFWSQSRGLPVNIQTSIQLHSFHMLASLCSKSFKVGFSSVWARNFQMYKLDLEKAQEPEIKLPVSVKSQKKQRNSRKTSTSASLTMLKPLTVWITTNCGKFLKRWEYKTTYLSPDKPVCRSRSNS